MHGSKDVEQIFFNCLWIIWRGRWIQFMQLIEYTWQGHRVNSLRFPSEKVFSSYTGNVYSFLLLLRTAKDITTDFCNKGAMV